AARALVRSLPEPQASADAGAQLRQLHAGAVPQEFGSGFGSTTARGALSSRALILLDDPVRTQEGPPMTRLIFGAAAFALVLATASFAQQQPQQVRVRGTIEKVDGPVLSVLSRDHQQTYKIKVADNASVRGIVKAGLADIKENSFIGVSGMPQSDGSQKALEIHIFPEAM